MVVFSFAGQKISVVFQRTSEGQFWRGISIATFSFEFFEFGFYNIFFVILELDGQGQENTLKWLKEDKA